MLATSCASGWVVQVHRHATYILWTRYMADQHCMSEMGELKWVRWLTTHWGLLYQFIFTGLLCAAFVFEIKAVEYVTVMMCLSAISCLRNKVVIMVKMCRHKRCST